MVSLDHQTSQVSAADGSGKRDLRKTSWGTAARGGSEAVMASLIVIALVMVVTGVLVGAFVAVSIAIHLGKRVRPLIWKLSDPPTQNSRSLTASGRRQ
jgi:hypothetical protein